MMHLIFIYCLVTCPQGRNKENESGLSQVVPCSILAHGPCHSVSLSNPAIVTVGGGETNHTALSQIIAPCQMDKVAMAAGRRRIPPSFEHLLEAL